MSPGPDQPVPPRADFYDQRRRIPKFRVALPLLKYAPSTQNSRVKDLRVGSDEDPKAVSMDKAMDREDQNFVIEAAYRQIFFHAFKVDRDRTLESQLRDGQITVRDFIRSLCLFCLSCSKLEVDNS